MAGGDLILTNKNGDFYYWDHEASSGEELLLLGQSLEEFLDRVSIYKESRGPSGVIRSNLPD